MFFLFFHVAMDKKVFLLQWVELILQWELLLLKLAFSLLNFHKIPIFIDCILSSTICCR